MDVKPPKSAKSKEVTRVDEGDDLIEHTAQYPGEAAHPPTAPKGQIPKPVQDSLRNAEILVSEALFEDAKRVLRKILREDPRSPAARLLLQNIHDRELAKLLKRDETPEKKIPTPAMESREIEERLLQDLAIQKGGYFQNELERESFLSSVEKGLGEASPEDRLAFGIGLIEIDLFEEAHRILTPILHAESPDLRASAGCLISQCQVREGKTFDAELLLREALCDGEINGTSRTALHYSLALVYESMGRRDQALSHYRTVNELMPGYRETERRIQILSGQG